MCFECVTVSCLLLLQLPRSSLSLSPTPVYSIFCCELGTNAPGDLETEKNQDGFLVHCGLCVKQIYILFFILIGKDLFTARYPEGKGVI